VQRELPRAAPSQPSTSPSKRLAAVRSKLRFRMELWRSVAAAVQAAAEPAAAVQVAAVQAEVEPAAAEPAAAAPKSLSPAWFWGWASELWRCWVSVVNVALNALF
jgi:hypothetical protein